MENSEKKRIKVKISLWRGLNSRPRPLCCLRETYQGRALPLSHRGIIVKATNNLSIIIAFTYYERITVTRLQLSVSISAGEEIRTPEPTKG